MEPRTRRIFSEWKADDELTSAEKETKKLSVKKAERAAARARKIAEREREKAARTKKQTNAKKN